MLSSPESGSSSGSGSDVLIPDQVSCQFSSALNFEVFTPTAELIRMLRSQCSNANPNSLLMVSISLSGSSFDSTSNSLLIEHLSVGQNLISVSVCGITCETSSVTYNVTVTVNPSSRRLFPYGPTAGDDMFGGSADSFVTVHLRQDNPVPFFNQYYDRLYVSMVNVLIGMLCIMLFDTLNTSYWSDWIMNL